jgi:hypothetical protein
MKSLAIHAKLERHHRNSPWRMYLGDDLDLARMVAGKLDIPFHFID